MAQKWTIGLVTLLLCCLAGSCDDANESKDTDSTDTNVTGADSASDSASETERGTDGSTDSGTTVEMLTCDQVAACTAVDTGNGFSCPAGSEPGKECMRVEACGGYDAVMCVTMDEACQIQCGVSTITDVDTFQCGTLDSDPPIVTCDL